MTPGQFRNVAGTARRGAHTIRHKVQPLKVFDVGHGVRDTVGEDMLEHGGESVGAEVRDAEGVMGVGGETRHGVGSVARSVASRLPSSVTVGDTLHSPQEVAAAGNPHIHLCGAHGIHQHRGCRTGGNRGGDRLSMQPHDVSIGSGSGGEGGGKIGQIDACIPRNSLRIITIVVATAHGPWAVERHHEVAKPCIIKRSAEFEVVPSIFLAEGVHDHLLEHRAVRDKRVQPRQVGVGQIDGTLAAYAAVATVEVEAGDHGWTVHLAG